VESALFVANLFYVFLRLPEAFLSLFRCLFGNGGLHSLGEVFDPGLSHLVSKSAFLILAHPFECRFMIRQFDPPG